MKREEYLQENRRADPFRESTGRGEAELEWHIEDQKENFCVQG